MSDTTSAKRSAFEAIKAITAKHGEAIGVEAVEFKPGAVVLLVARFAPHSERAIVEQLHRCVGDLVEGLKADGVRACAIALPADITLEAFEIPDAAKEEGEDWHETLDRRLRALEPCDQSDVGNHHMWDETAPDLPARRCRYCGLTKPR